MNIKPIKIAILSCNHGHAKGYYYLKDDPWFELVGVSVEPGYKDRTFMEQLDGIPKYDSDEELYANHPDIEAVVVGSANRKHYEQVKTACEKGLHIFSMKVPTFDLEQYESMIELTEKAGVVCQVELEMRHHAEIYRVKELIEQGAIGTPQSITMLNYSHNPVWWRPWQASPEESWGVRSRIRPGEDRFKGGALADHPHVFDAIQLITGSTYDTVFAEISPNMRPGIETEDLIHVIGKLKNGMTYSIDPSYANNEYQVCRMYDWEKYPRCVEVTLCAVGDKGTIIADVYGRAYYFQGGKHGDYLVHGTGMKGGWGRMMQEFYHCVRDGKKPEVGLREHYRTIQTMVAAYESVYTGKVIKM